MKKALFLVLVAMAMGAFPVGSPATAREGGAAEDAPSCRPRPTSDIVSIGSGRDIGRALEGGPGGAIESGPEGRLADAPGSANDSGPEGSFKTGIGNRPEDTRETGIQSRPEGSSESGLENGFKAGLEEMRSLFNQVDNLEKAMGPIPSRISPDLGRLQQDYEQAIDRIEFLKTQVLAGIERSLGEGRLDALDAYLTFIGGLSTAGRERRHFLPFSRAVRSKVIFQSLAQRHLPREGLDERLAFLEGNAGLLPPAATEAGSRPRRPQARVPIYIAFHWHMHQPIYWPGEDLLTTHNRGVYSFSLLDVFRSRGGPYTSWPFDAVKTAADAGLPHAGAQVSFSGSLIENLDRLATVDGGFRGWKDHYARGRRLSTALGNPRLDLVAFGFHHPLMALIGYDDIRRQIAAHREIVQRTFGGDVRYSRGIFPPENAFAEWMIPALVDEGLEWVMVDNIHFNRACQGYPWTKGENLYPPNPADQSNPSPGMWLQLNGLWAPSKVSAWADRPHWVEWIDPATGRTMTTPEGKKARLVAVPTERYLGNEDGRGGFGALNYEAVMAQLLPHNTDPKHPILLVLHHDGDNYGGGSDGYYHANFSRFVEWVKANPDRFVCTTVQDYLDRFPPDPADVIHVEAGSWSGADNGDPEFLKWNGDPNPATGYSPDRNSWGVMTAAQNLLQTARDRGLGRGLLQEAAGLMMVSQTSCYEYWDGTEMWDSHPTRACNQLAGLLLPALGAPERTPDQTPPALYLPQRQPYNPGGKEWGTGPEPADFTVWTYAYDHGGLAGVVLKYRVSPGQLAAGTGNRAYAGGTWQELPMTGREIPAQTNPRPVVKAPEFTAVVTGVRDALVDYYVEARDKAGNVAASPILHVHVGKGGAGGDGGTGGEAVLTFAPAKPTAADRITFTATRPGRLHWGVNGWKVPAVPLWPAGTQLWPDNKAVETPLAKTGEGKWQVTVGPFADPDRPVSQLNAVGHFEGDAWGKDLTIDLAEK